MAKAAKYNPEHGLVDRDIKGPYEFLEDLSWDEVRSMSIWELRDAIEASWDHDGTWEECIEALEYAKDMAQQKDPLRSEEEGLTVDQIMDHLELDQGEAMEVDVMAMWNSCDEFDASLEGKLLALGCKRRKVEPEDLPLFVQFQEEDEEF